MFSERRSSNFIRNWEVVGANGFWCTHFNISILRNEPFFTFQWKKCRFCFVLRFTNKISWNKDDSITKVNYFLSTLGAHAKILGSSMTSSNFWQFLIPLTLSRRFLSTNALVLLSQNLWIPPLLGRDVIYGRPLGRPSKVPIVFTIKQTKTRKSLIRLYKCLEYTTIFYPFIQWSSLPTSSGYFFVNY